MASKRAPILGNKEDTNFNEALKLYDSKQYKKALKLVDANLKKNSSHAASLTLKGCINYYIGNKPEAESYIVKGLTKGENNYIVNHLAGIYYRAVENYTDAAKWLKAAIDNGSPNKQILRDLSNLQVHIRDYKSLVSSRQGYLEFQPGYRANWTGTAIALHLNKNYKGAISTLTKIESIIKEHLQDQDMYEQSECLLYKNDIIFQSGDVQKALETLEDDKPFIKDMLSFLEYKAKYLMVLGRTQESSIVYRQLIQRNPDNIEYYKQLEICLNIFEKPLSSRIKLYENLNKFYPKADPPKYLPMMFIPSSHPAFKEKAQNYILGQLKKGVPASFVNIKPILKNPKKLKIIEEIVASFFENALSNYDPTIKVWGLYFLSQLSLYQKDLATATKYIDTALEHSPTLVELYILKARILKHYKKYEAAAQIMDEGRQLDLQDRFVNSKATKYYLRANEIDKAVDLISLFTKLDKDAVNGCKDLHTMQANWFITESAEAYKRLYHQYEEELASIEKTPENEEIIGSLHDKIETYKGLALKRYTAVVKIFDIFFNDQFDFHFYCLRRGTPRDYIKTLQWEDTIHSTPIYVRVIKGLSEIYLEIYKEQQQKKAVEGEDDGTTVIKKNNKKNKKAKAQSLKKKESLIAKVESEKDDADPLGTKLLSDLVNNAHGNIIDNLLKLSQPLLNEAKDYQFNWELSFKLNLIKSKYVLSLQAIKNLNSILSLRGRITSKIPQIEQLVTELGEAVSKDESVNEAIKKVVKMGLSASLSDYKEAYEPYLN
ncbi:hypothetical protein CANTEDRAFT_106172 [Yamadazyma tenuis ATCC 10573]|uniref:N-terminal acetyltransferase A, auxiliary subunit n=1 Tax=Candida tenuis (strain ATCC 10573 / BCRC 21748 / CBS 615 / JCM 9827 / NBRC 10315 / NRRL Y-1498 / VKM Y-70) TaxID=590646 RepID=G3B5V1_CANTC|nr:uncharacterized protein CANTEDRAFT_106172 [Yamadazyma tenuis ATCC 10573]EGV63311.1 hypothetical protein CANTEDRAFT_106172 [Yamadazyma tenuis ATCC 10573]